MTLPAPILRPTPPNSGVVRRVLESGHRKSAATPDIVRVAWAGAWLAKTAIRTPHARRYAHASTLRDHGDLVDTALLGAVAVGGLILPAVHLRGSGYLGANGVVSGRTRRRLSPLDVAGLTMLAASTWLFARAHADLGRQWSPTLEIAREHALVTSGVYRHVRHPMYTSQLLDGIAQAALLRRPTRWAGLATFGALLARRLPHEEAMMREAFPEEYDRYGGTTGALVPRLLPRRRR